MMTSDAEAYVWIWLPGETDPVVAGKLERQADQLFFNYGKSYLERKRQVPRAIALNEDELPLRPGRQAPGDGLEMPGCIRDAAPDAWGRRVILNRVLGLRDRATDTVVLDELTYLLWSGSDRIGALDFQASPTEYVPREAANASLEELLASSDRVERGIPLRGDLDQALLHGSSIGGARPKALIQSETKKYIAKFSASSDLYNVVKAEFVAMRMAALAGLDVAPVRLTCAAGRDVLLIERFDREFTDQGWRRRLMLSGLTLLGLSEMTARYASYEGLAETIRRRFEAPRETLRELYARLVFNVLCGNTDDHARNHAAFWDGEGLRLTPAYDICPQGRTGNEASQAMLVAGKNNLSHLKNCIAAAPAFQLSEDDAHAICDHTIEVIRSNWDEVCAEADLSRVDRTLLWGRQFLNPFSLQR